jgi:hypothetical protein
MEVEEKTDQRAADRPAKTVVAAVAAWLIKCDTVPRSWKDAS